MPKSRFDWRFLKEESPPLDSEVWVYVMSNRKRPVTLYTYRSKHIGLDESRIPAKWYSEKHGTINALPIHQWKLNSPPTPPQIV